MYCNIGGEKGTDRVRLGEEGEAQVGIHKCIQFIEANIPPLRSSPGGSPVNADRLAGALLFPIPFI